jgi:uncharacterized protein (TIGR02677 family)
VSDTFQHWRQVPSGVFGPLTAENRDDYMAVLLCFEADFDPALNVEALSGRLRSTAPHLSADDDALARTLAQLVTWNLVEESRDDSVTYSDPTEFRRRHAQWSLTGDGQATIAALNAAYDRLAAAAALQPAAIDAIASALADVADWLDNEPGVRAGGNVDSDVAAQVHIRLFDAESHHQSLIANLRAFTRDVAAVLGRSDLGDDDLSEARHHIVTYLDRYVVGTELPARRVAAALDRLEAIGYTHVARIAVDGENVAPGLDPEERLRRARERRESQLRGLHTWFSSKDQEPRFSELLPAGRDAVLSYLRVLGIRREVRRRNASLPEDFRALARAFAGCAGDSDAHRLWGAATGLTPTRHHHLHSDDVDSTHSWGNTAAQNPATELAVELRRRARSTGRPSNGNPVADRRAARAARQAQQAAELAEAVERRARLATAAPTRLAEFSELSDDDYRQLSELLADTLAAPLDATGCRSSRSSDGHVTVTVGPVDAWAAAHTAAITSPSGTLRVPDVTIHIELRTRPGATAGAALDAGVAL